VAFVLALQPKSQGQNLFRLDRSRPTKFVFYFRFGNVYQ